MNDSGEKLRPWIGTNYATGWKGIHLLVLGESSYGASATAPHDLVESHIVGRRHPRAGRWQRTYTRFLEILSNQRGTLDSNRREEIWNRLAFYNFLTTSAALRPKTPPPDEAWEVSRPSFFEFLQLLEQEQQAPVDGVIVWGHRLWHALEKRCKCLNGEGHGSFTGNILWPDGRLLRAFALKHPSAPATTFQEWAPRVARFLDDLNSRKTTKPN